MLKRPGDKGKEGVLLHSLLAFLSPHTIFIWLSCFVVYKIQFQEISGAMALELGESLLENMLGLNTSTDSDEEIVHMGDCQTSSLGDEFFHSKSEYGVSSGKCCQFRPKFLSGCQMMV